MLIGIDFDNTIVCYDELFHKVARERGLIPADLPVNKSEVRNHLRRIGKEDVWTEMQGYVYGARMSEAAPYPGAIEFFKACRASGIAVRIISHKTKHPFLGEPYDLHEAARRWLELNGFFDPGQIGLERDHVFFELTKQAKLGRIAECGCTHFIDDLPELLAEPAFPAGVHKILFDPARLYGTAGVARMESWEHASNLFPVGPVISDELLRRRIAALLARRGETGEFTLHALPGGGNNRVYRLQAGAAARVVKVYFRNPSDPRDRFGAERAFYEFAWSLGIRSVPEPVAFDEEHRLGMFGFVDGRKLTAEEVDEARVGEAVDFIRGLNAGRNAPAASSLPSGSEACFSIQEHLDCVQRRVNRLDAMDCRSPIDQEAMTFVREELRPAWMRVRTSITARAGTSLERSIGAGERVLSPSDFGFHNALVAADGKLRFFDFEYAGWDDAAKLVCDFFCQPQVPVDRRFWEWVVGGVAELMPSGSGFRERAEMLLPAYGIKWCCIILNDFIRADQARRAFALGNDALARRKAGQLEKARRLLAMVASQP